ncbi:uncharacterized protein TNCV_4890721 [Trichonephila clavipes]|nr:uncharacterized protein TNCV_4890721 [Trichonephila clavipes]
MAQQPMRARAYCAHPSIRDHWVLRCMSRCDDQVVSLKRDPQSLSPQASLVLIYRPTAVLDESRSFFRVHTGYFSNIPKCIKAEFIASWECSQSSVVSSSQR